VKDDLVYVCFISQPGIQIVDFSDPANPFEAGYLPIDTGPQLFDMIIDGNRGYVAAGSQDGLLVLDLTTPTSPTVIGSLNTPNVAIEVGRSGNYVYISDMWDSPGVIVANVSNPNNPTLQTTLSVPGTAIDGLCINSGRLYVTSLTDLSIFSLTNPASPTLLGTYSSRDVVGHAWGVKAKGGFLYLSDFRMGLKIFDIIDPANPTFLGKYRISTEAHGIEVVGNVAYVCNAWGHGIEAIDVSDKAHPQRTLKLTLPNAGTVSRAVASGHYLYATGSEGGVYVMDISNPLFPTFETRFDTNGIAQDIAVSGNALFVADGSAGVKVLDISNPPTLSSLTSITGIGNANVLDADGYRLVVGVVGPTKWEIRTYDVSNPGSPMFRDSINTFTALALAVSGDYALVQNHKAGIRAFDISDLGNVGNVAQFDTEASCDVGLAIDAEQIYSCDWVGGLNIFNISGGLGAPTSTPTITQTPTITRTPTPIVTPTEDLSCDENTWLTDSLQGATHGLPNAVTMTQFGAILSTVDSSISYGGGLPVNQGSVGFWITLLNGNTGGILFIDQRSTLWILQDGQNIGFSYLDSGSGLLDTISSTLPYALQTKRRPVHVQVSWGPSGQRIYLNGELSAFSPGTTSPRLTDEPEVLFGLGNIGGAQSAKNVLISNLLVSDHEISDTLADLQRPNPEPYPIVDAFPCTPSDAPPASILFLIGNQNVPAPGDAGLRDYLIAHGHNLTLRNPTLVTPEEYANYDLVIVSGSVGASSVKNLRDANVPLIIGEGAILSENGLPSDMHLYFGQSNPSVNGTLSANLVSPNHPILQGLPSPMQIFQTPSVAYFPLRQADLAGPGTTILLSPLGFPDFAALSVVETGAVLADGSRAPARRVHMPLNEGSSTNRFGDMTPEGKELIRRLVNWALGTESDCLAAPTQTPTATATLLPPSPTPFTIPSATLSATPSPTSLIGDLNANGTVGPDDLLILMKNWEAGQ
jgi:hypothetical protein